MPRGERAGDQRTVTFTASVSLVNDIDNLAASERRTRSNWLAKELELLVAERKGSDSKKKRQLPSPRSAEFAAHLSGSTSPHGLNEPAGHYKAHSPKPAK